MLLQHARRPRHGSGLLVRAARGLRECLDVGRWGSSGAAQAFGRESLAHSEQLLIVRGNPILHGLHLGEGTQSLAPRVGLQALRVEGIGEGATSLRVGITRVRPVCAGTGECGHALRAPIKVCRPSVQRLKTRALGLHTLGGAGQRGLALTQRRCERSSALARGGQGVRQAVEACALLGQGSLDLGDLRAESLQLVNASSGFVPLGLQHGRGRAGDLVELSDAAHEVLVAHLRVAQRALGTVALLVKLCDLLAGDLPVGSRRRVGVLGGPAHRAG